MNGNVSTISQESDPVFGLGNILLVATESTTQWKSLTREFVDFFDEIITVSEMREACRVLRGKRVTHVVISENFCRDLESAELIREWKSTFPDLGQAVIAGKKGETGDSLDIEMDAPVCCSHCMAHILHILFQDLL